MSDLMAVSGFLGFIGVLVAVILYLVRFKANKGAEYREINFLLALSIIFFGLGITYFLQ